jgi:cytochrome c oxidase assembly protein subunit 15
MPLMSSSTANRLAPRWLHGWSVFTAAATVALLALGAVVTTFQVGMADPIWPTYPWHLLLIDWSEPRPGFIIEHAHRLAGYIIGCCIIVLTAGLWFSARRNWLRWLGMAALIGVILQGLFGGFRVVLHALLGTGFAVVHGCFAQVVFSLLVSLAVLTSARIPSGGLSTEEAPRLRRWSLLLTAVAFVQLIWGALVRHTGGALAQRLHFLTAFAVIAVAVWFARTVWTDSQARRALGPTMIVLGILLTLQIALGVESWLGKFAGVLLPELHKPTIGQAIVRVSHVLIGSFVLAASVVLAVLTHYPAVERNWMSHATLSDASQKREMMIAGIGPQLEGTA